MIGLEDSSWISGQGESRGFIYIHTLGEIVRVVHSIASKDDGIGANLFQWED